MVLTNTKKRNIALWIAVAFMAVNAVLISQEMFWFTLFPAALIVLGLMLFSLDRVFLIIAFFTPLSFEVFIKELGAGIALPTEPLLIGMLVIILFKILYENPFPKEVWVHPITIIVLLNLTWMLLTSITSELPVVSFKYLLMQLWFIVPAYLFGTLLFKKERRIREFLLLFMIPLAMVVIYTTYQHSLRSFGGQAAHWVMYPFFNDHTAYGAVLAMFLPVGIVFTLDHHYNRTTRLAFALLTAIIFAGLLLSVSRAAWLSTFAAMGFFVILYFKIRFRTLMLGGLVALTLLFALQDRIISRMERNTQESEETDFAKHAQSMSNITTDASNLERLNRWSAAQRMIRERPVLGWGPGTYQFVYAPFQKSRDLTIISTNFGDQGNVHSEYIGPMCDSGIPGTILFVALIIGVISLTLKLLHHDLPNRIKWYLMAVFLGLTTYYVHGFLNNFLDTDKASIPFWGFTAIIVAIDLYHKRSTATTGSDRAQTE